MGGLWVVGDVWVCRAVGRVCSCFNALKRPRPVLLIPAAGLRTARTMPSSTAERAAAEVATARGGADEADLRQRYFR